MTTDYFKFYEIPKRFSINLDELKRIFMANSRKFHPDFHTLSDPENQIKMLEKSSLNNLAYNTLKDDDSRFRHLLELKGCWRENQKMEVPQSFLLEMMDINEQLMEAEMDPEATPIDDLGHQIGMKLGELDQRLREVTAEYDKAANSELLHEVKELLLKKQYLLRITEKLDTLAAQ